MAAQGNQGGEFLCKHPAGGKFVESYGKTITVPIWVPALINFRMERTTFCGNFSARCSLSPDNGAIRLPGA